MTRHSLRRVRINPVDETLHCTTHGLLPANEALDVLTRTHVRTARALDFGLPWYARAFDWIVSHLPARCEVIR